MRNNPENDRWLRIQFKKIPHAQRNAAMVKYSEVYKEAGFSESVEHARSCTANKAANTWLREFISNPVSKPESKT